MNTILQAAADFLKSKKFQPAFTEDGEILIVRCSGKHLFWTTVVDTSGDGIIVTLLSRVAVKVPPAKRAACARLLARTNYGKRLGAFHLDLNDGEVLYCVSATFSAGIFDQETFDRLFGTTFSAMDENAPQIHKLVYGTPQPEPERTGTSAAQKRNLSPPGLSN